jgi:hypothetical protein
MTNRVRPWRSRRAPAIGATSRPGNTLTNVTTPVSAGEWYSARVNRTSVTPTIDWAIRLSCIETRIRGSPGTASRAR